MQESMLNKGPETGENLEQDLRFQPLQQGEILRSGVASEE